ncbi:MAG: hypothetical protein HY738_00655 [Bacteroidia bacterium]|nr:hypothetical protein [Bacteroidia bacterium]
MSTTELLKAIENLPISKRIFLIEKAIHSIRQKEDNSQMKKAAECLYFDYKNNKELTIFTSIDFEDFYEIR